MSLAVPFFNLANRGVYVLDTFQLICRWNLELHSQRMPYVRHLLPWEGSNAALHIHCPLPWWRAPAFLHIRYRASYLEKGEGDLKWDLGMSGSCSTGEDTFVRSCDKNGRGPMDFRWNKRIRSSRNRRAWGQSPLKQPFCLQMRQVTYSRLRDLSYSLATWPSFSLDWLRLRFR